MFNLMLTLVLILTCFSIALLPVASSLSPLKVESRRFSLYKVDSRRLEVVLYKPDRYPLFSGPYRNWATLKTGGKQVQYGELVPALCLIDGKVVVVESPDDARRIYRQASLWIAAGPMLVRDGKPCQREEIRREYPNLDTDRLTSRVVLLVWRDGSVGFLFNSRASLRQMQSAAVRLEADYALNLDGGSCTVWQLDRKRRFIGKEVVSGSSWCIGIK